LIGTVDVRRRAWRYTRSKNQYSRHEELVMPSRKPSFFAGSEHYTQYFKETHAEGALDVKTKELMHLALTLAYHCEP